MLRWNEWLTLAVAQMSQEQVAGSGKNLISTTGISGISSFLITYRMYIALR